MEKAIISIEKINFRYHTQQILQDISAEIFPQDFVAIIGPNGGGKSTLLKLILGLEKAESGVIKIEGKLPSKIRSKIGYVPQFGSFDRHFPMRVRDVVLSSNVKNNAFFPWFSSDEIEKAESLLAQLKIDAFSKQRFGTLSGGQKQRALIARALFHDPDILILDEPTASVDSEVEKDIYHILKQLNKTKTILLVSHDIAFVSSYVNRIMCLNKRGCIHKTEELTDTDFVALYQGNFQQIHHQCQL